LDSERLATRRALFSRNQRTEVRRYYHSTPRDEALVCRQSTVIK
jgi:hypothetical protein